MTTTRMPLIPTRPPRWLIGAKVALAALLVCGAMFPHVGGFEGKGMLFRLPIFLAPALVVPALWLRRRGTYSVALDAGLTLPFLLDTAANAVGLYDHFDPTDDILHFLNWFILFGAIAVSLARKVEPTDTPRWLVWLAATGIGAMGAIAWEVAEYAVMRAGVGGLSLTHGDTLGDLVLSTTGGGVGAWAALRWLVPERPRQAVVATQR